MKKEFIYVSEYAGETFNPVENSNEEIQYTESEAEAKKQYEKRYCIYQENGTDCNDDTIYKYIATTLNE